MFVVCKPHVVASGCVFRRDATKLRARERLAYCIMDRLLASSIVHERE